MGPNDPELAGLPEGPQAEGDGAAPSRPRDAQGRFTKRQDSLDPAVYAPPSAEDLGVDSLYPDADDGGLSGEQDYTDSQPEEKLPHYDSAAGEPEPEQPEQEGAEAPPEEQPGESDISPALAHWARQRGFDPDKYSSAAQLQDVMQAWESGREMGFNSAKSYYGVEGEYTETEGAQETNAPEPAVLKLDRAKYEGLDEEYVSNLEADINAALAAQAKQLNDHYEQQIQPLQSHIQQQASNNALVMAQGAVNSYIETLPEADKKLFVDRSYKYGTPAFDLLQGALREHAFAAANGEQLSAQEMTANAGFRMFRILPPGKAQSNGQANGQANEQKPAPRATTLSRPVGGKGARENQRLTPEQRRAQAEAHADRWLHRRQGRAAAS